MKRSLAAMTIVGGIFFLLPAVGASASDDSVPACDPGGYDPCPTVPEDSTTTTLACRPHLGCVDGVFPPVPQPTVPFPVVPTTSTTTTVELDDDCMSSGTTRWSLQQCNPYELIPPEVPTVSAELPATGFWTELCLGAATLMVLMGLALRTVRR